MDVNTTSDQVIFTFCVKLQQFIFTRFSGRWQKSGHAHFNSYTGKVFFFSLHSELFFLFAAIPTDANV